MRTAGSGIQAALIFVLTVSTALQATPTLDVTCIGSSEEINGIRFHQADREPAATHRIRFFVRSESDADVSPGARGRVLPFDESTSHGFVRSATLGDVPIVNPDSTDYRQFLLGINDNSAADTTLFSLSKLDVYLGDTESLLDGPSFAGRTYRLAEVANR